MKILFVINSLANLAGSERVAVLLANGLSEKHLVSIVVRDDGKSAYELNEKVEVVSFNKSVFGFFGALKKKISKEGYDVVVSHNMGKLSLLLALMNIKAKLWSYEHVSYVSNKWFVNFLKNKLYFRVDKILVLTERDAKNYRGIHNDVVVVKNPSPFIIENSEYDITKKKIVSIGRLTYQKGYDLLIDSWAKIYEKFQDWEIEIYGDGEDKDLLRSMIEKKGINNIFLKGKTTDVSSVYKDAALYVMSSRYEGLPMVLIEAQSFGLPVISFDCPYGPAEIVTNNVNGFLVESENLSLLAVALEKMITNPELRKKFSKESFAMASSFSVVSVLQMWEEMLLGLK